jgi:hypothetical protein
MMKLVQSMFLHQNSAVFGATTLSLMTLSLIALRMMTLQNETNSVNVSSSKLSCFFGAATLSLMTLSQIALRMMTLCIIELDQPMFLHQNPAVFWRRDCQPIDTQLNDTQPNGTQNEDTMYHETSSVNASSMKLNCFLVPRHSV